MISVESFLTGSLLEGFCFFLGLALLLEPIGLGRVWIEALIRKA